MEALWEGVLSSSPNAGRGSEMAGVADTVGSAKVLFVKVGRGFLRSADLLETFELEVGIEGRLSSGTDPF